MFGRRRYIFCIAAAALGALVGFELPMANSRLDANHAIEAVKSAQDATGNVRHFRAFDPNALDGVREVISPRAPVVEPKLPEGCESPVSFMTRSVLVNAAARCLT